MKFNHCTIISLILICFVISKNVDDSLAIKSLKTIREEIYQIARDNMKTSSVAEKEKSIGLLKKTNGYPEHMISRAKDTRKNMDIFGGIMKIPIEVFRTCVYPISKTNYVKWCKNVKFGSSKKIISCQFSFCSVCCDHLQDELIHAASDHKLGTKLELTNKYIQDLVRDNFKTSDTLKRCKAECLKAYPSELPVKEETPLRDPELGLSKENPGKDCNDIKKWGKGDSGNGLYWISLGKGVFEVFCDMETDGGGWTLFLNYEHNQGQNIDLNQTVR